MIAAYSISKYIGAPGTGEASAGFEFGLSLLILWSVSFTLFVIAVLKGYERLLSLALSIVLASLSFLLFLAVFSFYLPPYPALIVSLLLSFLAFTRYRGIFQVSTAVAIGIIFPLLYPLYAIRFFSILLAAADLIATLKGPMRVLAGSLIEVPERPVEILALRLRTYSIGLGDLIVYASLPTSVMINVSPIAGIATRAMIPIGVYLSALWASKRGVVPALPIPVALMSVVIVLFLI